MRELLRFELFKLKKSPMVYVLLGIILFLIFQDALNIYSTILAFNAIDHPMDIIPPYHDMSADSFTLYFLGSPYMAVILLFFSSLKALDDVRTKTMKNIISRGYTRVQIYFAKYIISLCVAIIYAIVGIIFSFLIGLIFFGNASEYRIDYLFISIIAFIIITIALHSLNFGIATLFNSMSWALLFDIFGFLIIFSIINGIINSAISNDYYNFFSLLDYMPIALMDMVRRGALDIDIGYIFTAMGVAVGYAMLGIGIGYLGCKTKQY